MEPNASQALQRMVRHVGRYPEAAFLFVRDGLNYAVEAIHGPETQAYRMLARYLYEHDLEWNDLITKHDTRQLPRPIIDAVEAAGGSDKLNRHVTGRELCWGLRDYALERWGLLAREVLKSWHITCTEDFGRIVFAFIEHNLMQRQEGDTLEDFEDVYSFDDAFDKAFNVRRPHDADGSDDAPCD
ncbi:MAG: Minf_1886 family protein [Phycisphaerae bacterium]